MFDVYILRSLKTHRYYAGSTQDVHNRLREHNSGECTSTCAGIPWTLVWTEALDRRSAAMRNGVLRVSSAAFRKWKWCSDGGVMERDEKGIHRAT